MTWERATYVIETDGGRRSVDGHVHTAFDDTVFGVHRERDGFSGVSTWTVTHLPTGRAVTRMWTRADARRIAERLQALDVDWATVPVPLPPAVRDSVIEVVWLAGREVGA